MAEDKPGRPRVLIRRHVLEIKEETREWLAEELEKLQGREAAAKVAQSFLSTNAGVIIATFGVASTLLAVPATRKIIIDFLAFWRHEISVTIAEAIGPALKVPSLEDIRSAIQDAIDALFPPGEEPPEIIFGAAGPSGVPLTEEQKRLFRELGEQPPQ